MRLETARLNLRNLTREDIVPLAKIWSNPEVTRYLGGARDFENVRQSLEEDLPQAHQVQFDLWTLIQKSSGRVIGHCGLLEKQVDGRDEIELVYVLASDAWGRGYATEIAIALRDYAFRELGLRRLISLIEPENIASMRVAEKAGMAFEKEIVRPGGAIRRIYSIAKEEA